MLHLLLAIDDSAATHRAVTYVADLAPQLRDCKVRLVAVIPNLPSDSQQLEALLGRCDEPQLHGDDDQHQQLVTALALLRDYTEQLVAAGLPAAAVSSEILPGCVGVAQDLHEAALAQGCDTIVVGRREATLRHLLLGSVSAKLVEKAHALSVWVVG